MKLSEFVNESLTEILAGIRSAQKKGGGGDIAAESYGAPAGSNFFTGGTAGQFTVVDFDVSVAAETTGGGKAGIRVWSVGAEAGGEHNAQHANRIKFSVHVRIPWGDRVPKRAL
jgi:Trypsin-co-occurring domain 2